VHRNGNDAVMPRMVEIMMAPAYMDKRVPGTLERFNGTFASYPGNLHATTVSFSLTSTSTGTGFFRMASVSI
jgi:hypothetical protein